MEIDTALFLEWYEQRPAEYAKMCIQWNTNIMTNQSSSISRCYNGETDVDISTSEVENNYQNWLATR